jgi:hypothetical protein
MIAKRLLWARVLGAVALTSVALRPASAVLIVINSAPAPSVANHTTYTFVVDLDELLLENVVTFSATFNASVMNQINVGTTVWEDNNNMSFNPDDDSQFEFLESEWELAFADTESTMHLTATASNGNDGPALTADFELAHIVLPNNVSGTWQITVEGSPSSGNPDQIILPAPGQFGTFGAIPEASQVLLGAVISVAAVGMHLVRRFFKRAA